MPRFRCQRMKDESGYSLIELLAITAMLMFLSLFAVPIYDYLTDKARLATSLQDLRVMEQALEAYYTENGHYPHRLGILTEKGYLNKRFTFKSPWSNDKKTRYYFYTVGNETEPKAYLLGDPGPNTTNCRQTGTAILYLSNRKLLPCGINPNDPAWFFAGGKTNVEIYDTDGNKLTTPPKSLSGLRQPCDPRREKDMEIAPGCIVKTES